MDPVKIVQVVFHNGEMFAIDSEGRLWHGTRRYSESPDVRWTQIHLPEVK